MKKKKPNPTSGITKDMKGAKNRSTTLKPKPCTSKEREMKEQEHHSWLIDLYQSHPGHI